MSKYSVDAQDTNTASTTMLALDGTTTTRGRLYDIIVGSDATPADNAWEWNIRRFAVNNGTGTAVTPNPLDMADAAAEIDGTFNHSVEPSITANSELLQVAMNQSATFRWVAAPGGEAIIPATSDSGINLISETVAGSAVDVNITFHYEE